MIKIKKLIKYTNNKIFLKIKNISILKEIFKIDSKLKKIILIKKMKILKK